MSKKAKTEPNVVVAEAPGVRVGAAARVGYTKASGAHIGINVMGVKVPYGPKGRIDLDQAESLQGRPPRLEDIKRGTANIGADQILVLGADGNSKFISKADNDRTDNVGWDVKMVAGVKERERIGTVTLGKVGDDKFEWDGDGVPFECLREATRAASTHFNVAHFRYSGGARGVAWFRQWRLTADGVRHESDWFGASDGKGFRIGSQA